MRNQRLYWSIGNPWKAFGLTIDEWISFLVGFAPGVMLLSDQEIVLGLSSLFFGFGGCWVLKKFKKISEHFLLKSWLFSKGLWPRPSKDYPVLKGGGFYK